MKWSRYSVTNAYYKAKLSFDLFAQQHGNDGLFAGFYRHPGSAILLQKQVSKASIAKIVGVSLPHHLPLYQDKAATPTPLNPSLTVSDNFF
jgi:hypothetical protein